MLTYVLTASVYCTAWTFYGSVGLAANRGLEFLTIYLGPALVALLWPVLLRRLVRVAKEQRITSISDFISSRYGKSAPLGALVAGLVVRRPDPVHRAPAPGGVPVLQADPPPGDDPRASSTRRCWWPSCSGLFGILFGARNPDFTQAQRGLLTAVAVESVVKLLAFLIGGRLRHVGPVRRVRRHLRAGRSPTPS